MEATRINSLYEAYKIDPDFHTTSLVDALEAYAQKLGRVHFERWYNRDEFRDVCHDSAINVFMAIARFDSTKSRFSTWTHNSITHDLMNWVRDQEIRECVSLDDEENPVDVADESLSPETKLYYKELLDKLTRDERDLFALLSEGYTQAELAEMEGVTQKTISVRRDKMAQKLRALHGQSR